MRVTNVVLAHLFLATPGTHCHQRPVATAAGTKEFVSSSTCISLGSWAGTSCPSQPWLGRCANFGAHGCPQDSAGCSGHDPGCPRMTLGALRMTLDASGQRWLQLLERRTHQAVQEANGAAACHRLGQAAASRCQAGTGSWPRILGGVKPYTRCLLSLSTAWGWFCLPTAPTTSRPTSATRSCK